MSSKHPKDISWSEAYAILTGDHGITPENVRNAALEKALQAIEIMNDLQYLMDAEMISKCFQGSFLYKKKMEHLNTLKRESDRRKREREKKAKENSQNND